ncbi:DUF6069 family protein [Brevibacterium spongiae]|uniref:DUF6069 family protein n=1 Tax=Brevibacterium spongiae TaxID=2909672 RepID=A0ABY5SL03_9MICO|nr:DUF6069 family protein [Brevibacterium spongiae]UVI35228.1 DUF6069 family protein [Brevibacterium spongiae]
MASAAVVILTAVFAALAVWVITVPIAGVTLTASGRSVSPAAVALVSLGSGCAASISYLIARRFRSGPVIWTVLGCIVLVLSMTGPLLSGATGSVLVVLEVMHVLVGGTMMLGLLLFVPRRMRRAPDRGSAASVSAPSTAVSE